MASKPKSNAELARDRARNLLDTNNSLGNNISDKIFSLLEGGEGNLYLRNQVDHFLDKHMTNAGIASQREKLEKYLSIKDKIAYTTGVMYENNITPPNTAVTPLDEDLIQDKLKGAIKYLEDNLIQNQEFTESWILRNSAYNRFECKMNAKEEANLNSVASEVKELCKKNNLDTLVDSNNGTKESHAQIIVKLTENIGQISARGINIDEELLKKVATLEEKIKPLKDLDKKYKHLINMLNMTTEIARRKYKSMISVTSQEKLLSIMGERGKKEQDFIITSESKDGDQFQLLEEKLSELRQDGKYGELIRKHHLSKNQFDEWFLVYFTYRNVENAKIKLDAQKKTTFGHKEKDYDLDCNKRKGNVREKIFEIGNRMVGPDDQRNFPATPQGDQDYATICSYFDKFQNIFFANERDAYDTATGESHFMAIRNVLSAMLRRRVPAICNGGHERYGSLPRKMKKRLEWFLKGKEEKGIFRMVRKRWHQTDHAGILAMVIMIQNQTDQEMFHGKNPFQKKDKRYSKVFRGMGLAEQGRERAAEAISPVTNRLMKIAEVSTKKVGKGLVAGAQAYNNGLKNYKRWKTPFYALYPATWIAAQGGKAYNGVKKYLSEIQGKQVNYIYESVADGVESVAKFGAKTIAGGGKSMYRQFETNQQRSVLGTFFQLAAEDDRRKEVLQSSDLANMFNVKHRETYLFDEDGRTQMVDQSEKAEKDSPEGSTKELAEKMEKQIEALIEQAADDIRDKKEAQKAVDVGTDEKAKTTARINFTHANEVKNIVNDFQGDLSKLVPVLKKSVTGTPPTRRYGDIRNIVGTLIDLPAIAAAPATATMQAITARPATTGQLTSKINALRLRIGSQSIPGIGGAPATPGSGLEEDIKEAKRLARQHGSNEKAAELNLQMIRSSIPRGGTAPAALGAPGMDIATQETARSTAEQARLEAEDAVTNKERELSNAKDLMTWLEKVNEILTKFSEVNENMQTALMTIPPADTKPIAEELNQLTKYLDILLYPGKKEEGKTVKLKDFTAEQLKKELELRDAA